MLLQLSIKNVHPRDYNLKFDEATHTYTINGDSNYKSVTTWIHDFFPRFNSDLIIKKMRGGKNWTPDNQYYNMLDSEIKDLWANNGKDASEKGTEMHLNIEYYYNKVPVSEIFKKTIEYKMFLKFLTDHSNYKPYRTEWAIYSKKYLLAGSIDMIFKDPENNDKVIIADWKRCKEIKYSNKWEKGYEPLSNIDNCNYWHYTLQLNVYKTMLETNYGLKVSCMFLVVIHPNNEDTYKKIKIPIIDEPIRKMFIHRKNEITK